MDIQPYQIKIFYKSRQLGEFYINERLDVNDFVQYNINLYGISIQWRISDINWYTKFFSMSFEDAYYHEEYHEFLKSLGFQPSRHLKLLLAINFKLWSTNVLRLEEGEVEDTDCYRQLHRSCVDSSIRLWGDEDNYDEVRQVLQTIDRELLSRNGR